MKNFSILLIGALLQIATYDCVAKVSIEKNLNHPRPVCQMKNLDVSCDKGDKIKLDVARSLKTLSPDVFLTINTHDTMGEYVLISINNNKAEVIKMENVKGNEKRAHLSTLLISKLRSATSVRFEISMKKRAPIVGKLDHQHFKWLSRFGAECA